MKIQLVSDLHLEFLDIEQVKELADNISLNTKANVLILAGDICSFRIDLIDNLYTFLDIVQERYDNIVYVLGNHEYYGCSYEEVELVVRAMNYYRPNVHILNNSSVELRDIDSSDSSSITFYGTTLWFEETVEASLKKYSFNDYHQIKNFTPDIWCRKAISYIKQIPNDESKKILITHHVPHSRFISPKYLGSEMNCFYLNEVGKYLNKFDLVTFGHSHESVDQQFSDRTKAISNPRGYINFLNTESENEKFKYQLIVEV